MTKNRNFCGVIWPDVVDTEYEDCNFCQYAFVDDGFGRQAGTRIFPGDGTPRVFRHCNLVNCVVPPGSTIENCNTALNKCDPNTRAALENHGRIDSVTGEATYWSVPVVFEL